MCAWLLEARIKTGPLTRTLSDQIIGVGVAADWLRRAAEMEDITYIGDQLNESSHKEGFVELIRYGFAWSGLNAIFSRPLLLNVIGTSSGQSEYDDFLVLFNAAPVPDAAAITTNLHDLLAAQTSPRLPDIPLGTTVSTLGAIYHKYIPAGRRRGRTAQALTLAASTGNIAALDLQTMLYGFRNWSVHGNAFGGSFGTRPGFLSYVGLLQQALAEVHRSTAELLRAKL